MIDVPNSKDELAKRIDHTLLKPQATRKDFEKLVQEAEKYRFRAVCVPQYWVPFVRELLWNEDIKVVTVVGFPLGYVSTSVKVKEAEIAKQLGADEIDMVMNISAFKSGNYDDVADDIKSVVLEANPLPVKVIIETSYLTEEEIKKASLIAIENGAKFVKTNTGFGPRGASINDVHLIRSAIGNKAKIKAAGGIKTAKQALSFIVNGADIIGASAGVNIIKTFSEELLNELDLSK